MMSTSKKLNFEPELPLSYIYIYIYIHLLSHTPLKVAMRIKSVKMLFRDFPNASVAKKPVLPMQGAQVQPLVRELNLTCCN